MTQPARVATYYRISRDRTGEEAGIRRQEHECRQLVAERGWETVGEFTDNDLSAYTGKPRPAFDRLLEAVRTGAVDVVVAWHPDRLVRHPRELEDVIDTLDAAGCPVETVRAGRWDLTTRSGRTSARLIGAVARDESEAKSERLRSMHEAKARAGEWPGGPRPYGYEPVDGALVVVEAEAAVVREAASRVLAGESVHGVCADLNERSVPTARGGRWRAQSLVRILTGATVAGRREHRGEDVGRAAWPPIIDAATSRRVAAALDVRGQKRGPVARVSLLVGLARCAKCGANLATQRRTTGVRVYVCPARTLGGCGGISIVADPVDDFVASEVVAALGALADANALDPGIDEEPDGTAEIEQLESDLAELASDLGSGLITRMEWLSARETYLSRLDALRSTSAGGSAPDALRGLVDGSADLAAAWSALTFDQRRQIVRKVVQEVTISPAARRGPGFDSGRIELSWSVS